MKEVIINEEVFKKLNPYQLSVLISKRLYPDQTSVRKLKKTTGISIAKISFVIKELKSMNLWEVETDGFDELANVMNEYEVMNSK